MKSTSIHMKQNSLFPPPSDFKSLRKKDYISMNGSIVKATIDTGISFRKKKRNIKLSSLPIPNTTPPPLQERFTPEPSQTFNTESVVPRPVVNTSTKVTKPIKKKKEFMSPIQTQTKSNPHAQHRRRFVNNKEEAMEGGPPLESPKRPFSLPLIEKKAPIMPLDIEPLRSSTGGDHKRHHSVPISNSNSLTSLTLEIDLTTDEIITKKEKRQWREFKVLTEDYQDKNNDDILFDLVRLNSIGKGSSASVYKSVIFPTLQVVADKVVILSNKDKSSQIIRELKSLKVLLQSDEIDDMSIVKLIDVYPNPRDGTLSMCLEYMNGGSLQEIVRSGGCQNELILAGLSSMILKGIAYLHSKRQLHRDIKPGNILLNCGDEQILQNGQKYFNGRVKISDFGLSKELEKGHSLADSFLGTFHYMSPERISGGDYSFPSDIWSFGMTILAVALGRYPFVSPNSARSLGNSGEVITEGDGGYWAILQAIQERPSIKSLLSSCQYNCERHSHAPCGYVGDDSSPTAHDGPSPSFSKSFHSFLSQCLQKDPKQRPTAHSLLQHPFLKRYPVNSTLVMAGDFSLTPASYLTDDFIRQSCLKHKENMEAKAISARNRLSRPGLFGNSSELQVPRSGEKTADNNVPHRRRLRQQSSNLDLSLSTQDEGIKQLRTVIKAYREYLNRTWGKKDHSSSYDAAPSYNITSIQSAEKIILATLTPLHSKSILTNISDALNVPLSVVKKTFQKIIRELKEHITSSSSMTYLLTSGSKSSSSSASLSSLTALLEKGFPSTQESEETTPIMKILQTSPEKVKNPTPKPLTSLATTFEEGNFESIPFHDSDGPGMDKLDRSDGSDVAAVEELRALMNTRSKVTATMDVKDMLTTDDDDDVDEEYTLRIMQNTSRSETLSGRDYSVGEAEGAVTTRDVQSPDDQEEEEEEYLPTYSNLERSNLVMQEREVEEGQDGEEEDEEDHDYDDDFEDDPA